MRYYICVLLFFLIGSLQSMVVAVLPRNTFFHGQFFESNTTDQESESKYFRNSNLGNDHEEEVGLEKSNLPPFPVTIDVFKSELLVLGAGIIIFYVFFRQKNNYS